MNDLESRFTEARPDCPHPEHWHSADPDSTEQEVTELVAAMVRALQPEYVIETGSAFGQTSKAIGRALVKNGHGRLVTLETDPARAKRARRTCQRLPVTVLETSSLEFTPEEPVDFLWIDSLLPLRAQELRRYAPYCSPRAVAGVHDTGPQHGGSQRLDPLVSEGVLSPLLTLPTPRGVSFCRVRT